MEPRNGGTTDRLGCPEPKREKDPLGPTAKFALKLDQIADALGGIDNLMGVARQCGDKKVREVVHLWGRLGDREKATASLDQFCQEVGITPGHLLGQLMAFVWRRSIDASRLIASLQMPAVMAKTIARGLQPDGFKERKMFLEKIVPALWPANDLAATLNSDQARSLDTDQTESPLEIPRVEDDSVVDRMFRDLGEE